MEGRLALWLPPERAPADGWGLSAKRMGWGGGESMFVQGFFLFFWGPCSTIEIVLIRPEETLEHPQQPSRSPPHTH